MPEIPEAPVIGTEDDYIKIKKVLADFVELRKPAFNNLFDNDEITLIDIITKIDEKWVANEDGDGLFGLEDRRLLSYLKDTANLSHLTVSNISTLQNYSNTKHIIVESDSGITLSDYSKTVQIEDEDGTSESIEQGVKIKVNDSIMKLLKFNSDSSNINISYDTGKKELIITQKKFEFISEEFRTQFDIEHNLDTMSLGITILCRDENTYNYTEEFAKIEHIDNNNIKVKFTEAVKCKIIITML